MGRQTGAAEQQRLAEEIAAEFDGVDPRRPFVRERLRETRQRLVDIHEQLKHLNVAMDSKEEDVEICGPSSSATSSRE